MENNQNNEDSQRANRIYVPYATTVNQRQQRLQSGNSSAGIGNSRIQGTAPNNFS